MIQSIVVNKSNNTKRPGKFEVTPVASSTEFLVKKLKH